MPRGQSPAGNHRVLNALPQWGICGEGGAERDGVEGQKRGGGRERGVECQTFIAMFSMVRESQGVEKYQGAKVNKDAEKNFELLYSSLKFFLLAFLADYLYLHFYICSTAFVSSVITSN